MYQLQTNLDELSRCEERRRMPDYGKSLTPIQIRDSPSAEQLLIISVNVVRHMIKNSGFLTIRSTDST